MDFVSGIIGVVRGAMALATALTSYLNDKKLIEAGKAEAIMEGLSSAKKQMDKVAANRARFRRDPKYAARVRGSFKLPR